MGHGPTLGTFRIQASSMPFLELKASVLLLFCQVVLIIWDFPSLVSWLTGLATFLYQTKSGYGGCYC